MSVRLLPCPTSVALPVLRARLVRQYRCRKRATEARYSLAARLAARYSLQRPLQRAQLWLVTRPLLTARRSTRKRTASAWKTGKTAGSDQTGIRPLSASASKSGRVIAVEMIVVELREPTVRAPAELVLQPAHDQRRPPRPRGGRHVLPARCSGCSALAFSGCVRKKKRVD